MDHNGLTVSYGSVARREDDELSDADLLLVSNCNGCIDAGFDRASSVSHYTWLEFGRMAAYGSLFLLHLKLEGKILEGAPSDRERYLGLLSELPPYKLVARDIGAFRATVEDVAQSIISEDSSILFELSTLGTVVRHASILGCYLIGRPTFGRYTAVQMFSRSRKLQFECDDFEHLYMYRLASVRNVPMPATPSPEKVQSWIRNAEEVVEECAALC